MNPHVDFHAIAPELVLTATILVVLIVDLIWPDRSRFNSSRIASVGVLAALIPVITLAADGTDRVLFGGAFVVDDVRARVRGLLPRGHVRRAADVVRLHLRRRLLPGRVLLPDAHVGAGHVGDGVGARPHLHLRRAGDDHDPHVHPRRVAQARLEVERSDDQVLHHRRAVVGDHALRHVDRLRRDGRLHAAGRHPPVDHRARHVDPPRRGDLPHHRRLRVQGERGAVPLLDARHLRGRAHAGHRVPLDRVEGRRVRGPAHDHPLRVLPVPGLVGTGALGAGGGVDHLRKPGRAAPDQHRPHAGLLVDRPGRLHPRAARGGGRRRRGARVVRSGA